MERFAGRVAVITGVSAGIGAAIAEDLVKAGMHVVGIARRVEKVQDLAKQLSGSQGKLTPLQGDMSDSKQISDAFQWIEKNVGAITVLINNAGVLKLTSVQDSSPESIMQLFNTNVLGLTMCSREAIQNMKRHNVTDGHIINISSVTGHRVPVPQYDKHPGMYAASKHAVTAMSKCLRGDVRGIEGFHIRITNLSPGAVDTEMVPKDVIRPKLRAKDVSNAVVYVLSCPPQVEIVELTIEPTGEEIS